MTQHTSAGATSRTNVPLDVAQTRLQSRIVPHGRTETRRIDTVDGCILAESITAERSVPHYRRAAMDGYAIRGVVTHGASQDSPVVLQRTDSDIDHNTATYVHTGSELPDGADTVVRVEKVRESDKTIRITDPVEVGKDIAPIGEDVQTGQTLYHPGHRLSPPDIGVLKSIGINDVEVVVSPTVAIIPTGDEIVETDPDSGEIIETNSAMISLYVDRWGGSPKPREIVPDDQDQLKTMLRDALSCDIVVTIGGSSVGKRDLLPEVIREMGKLYVHHVAIKPGHPVGLGEIDGTPILALPGYPVASILNAVQFLRPALYWLRDRSPPEFLSETIPIAEPIKSKRGTRRFERVRLQNVDGERVAVPVEKSGSGALTSVSLADGWVVIDEHQQRVQAGESVIVRDWNTSM